MISITKQKANLLPSLQDWTKLHIRTRMQPKCSTSSLLNCLKAPNPNNYMSKYLHLESPSIPVKSGLAHSIVETWKSGKCHHLKQQCRNCKPHSRFYHEPRELPDHLQKLDSKWAHLPETAGPTKENHTKTEPCQ